MAYWREVVGSVKFFCFLEGLSQLKKGDMATKAERLRIDGGEEQEPQGANHNRIAAVNIA